MHLAPWPVVEELTAETIEDPADERASSGAAIPGSLYGPVTEVLEALRREKSVAKVSPRAAVTRCVVAGPRGLLDAVTAARDDLVAAGSIAVLELVEADSLSLAATLATS